MTRDAASRRRLKWAHRTILASLGLLIIAVGGCAPGPQLVTTSLQAPGGPAGTVCVLSVVGKRFALQRVGFTVFGNSHDTVDISAWGLDELIAR